LSGRITLSTTDEAESLYKELETDIDNIYGGKSAFWRSCLMRFDDQSRIKAKIEMIEDRVEQKKKEIRDLKLQKKGLQSELDEIEVSQEQDDEIEVVKADQEFWSNTINKIFRRTGRDQPADVEDRFNKWFDGRHKLFVNKYGEITASDFKEKLMEKAYEKGFDEEVEKLQ